MKKTYNLTFLITTFLLFIMIITFDYVFDYEDYLISTSVLSSFNIIITTSWLIYEIKTNKTKSKFIMISLLSLIWLSSILALCYLWSPICLVISIIVFSIVFSIIWIIKLKEVWS